MSGWSRRRFLVAGTLAGSAVALGCTGGRSDAPAVAERAEAYDPELDCSDTVGLFPAEIETRVRNEYTQRSPHDDQYCFNCSNFIAPAEPETCGTCKTVKGPIQPLGWCKSWTEKRS